MDFKEVVQSRRSVRKYTDQEISEADIREIVRVASYSPSWKNSQTVSYIVVKDDEVMKKNSRGLCMWIPVQYSYYK